MRKTDLNEIQEGTYSTFQFVSKDIKYIYALILYAIRHSSIVVGCGFRYGVEKAGLTMDINARSSCGHTPLHISAIHGHKNIMRLLVKKFSADVKLRDTAGKKPWQYLSHTMSPDIFQLLGAPARASLGEGAGARKADHSLEPQQHRRRHRRHHFSSASGDRPLTIAGTAKVKRSTSIAALLKHKSLRRIHGHLSESSI